jgi:hypothetical protein
MKQRGPEIDKKTEQEEERERERGLPKVIESERDRGKK